MGCFGKMRQDWDKGKVSGMFTEEEVNRICNILLRMVERKD